MSALLRFSFFLLILPAVLVAADPCPESKDPLQRLGFQIPQGSGDRIDFPINKKASELRGKLTDAEKKDIASDKKVWDRMRLKESRVKPTANDASIYPASGVDFGLPINTIDGAGLYIGVDVEDSISPTHILKWQKDPTFDASKLFSQRPYHSTIPYMVTGSAGERLEFFQSHLKNLACSLPDEAEVLSLSFIVDHKPIPRWFKEGAELEPVGPHTLVTWCHNGVKQSSLLISAPMPAPATGKGVWWYDF